MGNIKKSLKRKCRKENGFPTPNDVTEGSLQVWRALPSKIRHDPSLASFQMEHDRLHADEPEPEDEYDENIDAVPEDGEMDETEFITIKVTNVQGEDRRLSESHSTITTIHQHADNNHEILHHDEPLVKLKPWQTKLKILVLFAAWLTCTAILTRAPEKVIHYKQIVVPELGEPKNLILPAQLPLGPQILMSLDGPFLPNIHNDDIKEYLTVSVQLRKYDFGNNFSEQIENIASEWTIPLIETDKFEKSEPFSRKRLFDLGHPMLESLNDLGSYLRIQFSSNSTRQFSLKLGYDSSPIDMHIGVLYAGFILIVLYIFIIWEISHRTFAAVLASIGGISVLAALNDRPTMNEIVEWMDIETLLLLFSMMILVAVLTETGVFDRVAVTAFKITNGKIWPLIHCLCLITTLVSAFLDNVTTILLMTPITIRLCEVMELNPIPVLMGIIVHANTGGTMTPVGDPPNIIITSNQYIAKHGVTFLAFTLHMTLGVLLVIIQTNIHLRIQYRDIHDLRLKEPKELKELRREITVWERTAASLSSYSKDVDLVRLTLLKKVKILRHKLKKKELAGPASTEAYKATLVELKQSYPIKNKPLLIKSGFVLALVITLFFIQSVPALQRLSLGWCALLGVILLLIIANKDDMDALMHRVEWTTLLFFAAMFVTMEALARLGLINWIGKQTENIILSVGEDARLAVAIIIILWISAITSAFVDSIPVTAMMVKVVVSLAENEALGLPIQPLVWALAFGPCLGGNGTLYGASANVVCAGIAEQHGYKITFIDYMKVCFPIMIGSVIVITGYLMFAHVLFTWH